MIDDNINANLLGRLFSIVLEFDSDWVISNSSEVVEKYMPGMSRGARLTDLFSIHRPSNIRDTHDLQGNQDALFLLVSRDRHLAIRGQIIASDSGVTFCFVGSPWLGWMTAHRPNVHLSLSDFGKQDAQLDQLFLMSTEKNMVSDLESLNVDLKIARDAAESANKVKSDFLAVMSHEMRTPLNAIVSALLLLEDKDLAPDSAQLVELARHSCQDLLAMINYALDSAKLESGKFELENNVFNIRESVATIADVLRTKAAEKGLELECTIAEALLDHCNADITKIRQILFNFISNAIKFTDSGKVIVRVTDNTGDDDQLRLRFEVEDTGSGIPPDHHDKVFDAFWSSNLRASNAEAGTGLGLDISKRLVEILHGTIGFESAVDQGSTFWFEVPVQIIEEKHADVRYRSQKESLDKFPHQFEGRVLLVDDNPTNLILGRLILEKLGVRVETVSDGSEAVEMVDSVPFDLVLMDITMPVMNGFEATDRIREKPETRELPIVALTAHVSSEEHDRCLSHGMNDFLTKPLEKAELVRVFNSWLVPRVGEDGPGGPPGHVADSVGAAIDEPTLERLLQDIGADGFQLVIESFLQELANRKQALHVAWEANAHDDIAREAHTLAGSARSFGAIDFADSLLAIESAARKNAPERASKEMMELDRKSESAAEALEHFVGGTAPAPGEYH